jgi:hypothetical protein
VKLFQKQSAKFFAALPSFLKNERFSLELFQLEKESPTGSHHVWFLVGTHRILVRSEITVKATVAATIEVYEEITTTHKALKRLKVADFSFDATGNFLVGTYPYTVDEFLVIFCSELTKHFVENGAVFHD